MKSKKIYIIQMHTHTMPARIIKLATRYEYSHIAISLTADCSKIYSFGRKNPNSILDGGFVVENKDGEFFHKFNKTICRIYEIDVTKKQFIRIMKKIKFMEKYLETFKYDYFGIILRFFRIPVRFKNRYVCSFFVAEILERANIYKFNKKILFIEPKDFEKIRGIKKVYEGNYLELRNCNI